MCREWAGPEKQYEKFGIRQLRLQTWDTAAPTLENLQRGIAFAKGAPAGTKTFIHCKGGIGRAATMAISVLMDKQRHIGPKGALEQLTAKRSIVSQNILKYPVVKQLHDILTDGTKSKGESDKAPTPNKGEL